VRDNILFGKSFDEEHYINTVFACQMESDMTQFKAGDMSEIGERGITLSGG
jgi:ABC-type bacteriocin/lantibiotic exporter with double-glycine peptidase domain